METMDTLKKRQIELERQSNVSEIEAVSLTLDVNNCRTFKIKDLQTYQRLRTRFNRLKSDTGRIYETEMEGNNITVTRRA